MTPKIHLAIISNVSGEAATLSKHKQKENVVTCHLPTPQLSLGEHQRDSKNLATIVVFSLTAR